MKSSALKVTAVIAFLLFFAGANVGAFLLSRASVELRAVSWEDTSVFYARIVERQGRTFQVEGLSVNDANHRGQFSFPVQGDTCLLWRGEEIGLEDLAPGQNVAVAYSREGQEGSPVSLPEVYQVLLLEDQAPGEHAP